jgi:hypothetical protein
MAMRLALQTASLAAVTCMTALSPALAWVSQDGGPLFQNVHQMAIEKVLRPRVAEGKLSEDELNILKGQQHVADQAQYQVPGQSHLHSMTGIEKSSDTFAAQKKVYIPRAEQYVRSNLIDSIAKRKNGSGRAAMEDLGKAIHALEDATSPAHEEFKPWRYNETWWTRFLHAKAEHAYPTGEYQSRLEGAVLWAYDIYLEKIPMPERFFDADAAGNGGGRLLVPAAYLH